MANPVNSLSKEISSWATSSGPQEYELNFSWQRTMTESPSTGSLFEQFQMLGVESGLLGPYRTEKFDAPSIVGPGIKPYTPNMTSGSTVGIAAEKELKRKARNRLSSAKSRALKKTCNAELQTKIKDLEEVKELYLDMRSRHFRGDNDTLRKTNDMLAEVYDTCRKTNGSLTDVVEESVFIG